MYSIYKLTNYRLASVSLISFLWTWSIYTAYTNLIKNFEANMLDIFNKLNGQDFKLTNKWHPLPDLFLWISCPENLSFRTGYHRSSPSHKRPWQLNIPVIWGEDTQWRSMNLHLNPQGIYSHAEETNNVIGTILIPLQEKMWVGKTVPLHLPRK